jgi:glutathione S-transferase
MRRISLREAHLKDKQYFVGGAYSVADIALYAYTHVADEGSFSLDAFPAIDSWLKRVAAEPKHVRISDWQ